MTPSRATQNFEREEFSKSETRTNLANTRTYYYYYIIIASLLGIIILS